MSLGVRHERHLEITLRRQPSRAHSAFPRDDLSSRKTVPWQSRYRRPQSIGCCEGRANSKKIRRFHPACAIVFQSSGMRSEGAGACCTIPPKRFPVSHSVLAIRLTHAVVYQATIQVRLLSHWIALGNPCRLGKLDYRNSFPKSCERSRGTFAIDAVAKQTSQSVRKVRSAMHVPRPLQKSHAPISLFVKNARRSLRRKKSLCNT